MGKTKKTKWWAISAANDTAEILLYEEIDDFFGTNAKSFVEDLNALGDDVKTINVRINSPGGSVYQGVAIYNALKRHPAHVNVFIDGVALSMASGIAMAGDTVTMVENGLMMLHNAMSLTFGNADEMRREAEKLDKVGTALVSAYVQKSGRDESEIRALLDAETWLTAEEAYDLGLVDAISEAQKMAASYDADSVSVPAHLRGVFQSLIKEPENMATPQPAGDPQPATLQQLEALKGATDKFVLDCLRDKKTIDAAKDELIGSLSNKVSDLETIVAEQSDTIKQNAENALRPDQLAQGTSVQHSEPPQPASSEPSPAPTEVGNAPVVSTSAPDSDAENFGGDPLAFFNRVRAEVKEELKKRNPHPPVNQILGTIAARYPGLYDAIEAAQ